MIYSVWSDPVARHNRIGGIIQRALEVGVSRMQAFEGGKS